MTGDVKPIVSIVLIARGHAFTLARTLQSLARQTVDLEAVDLIVVDDGTVNDSITDVVDHAPDELRVRIIRHDVNRGRSAARNTGLAAARGDIVMFLDADSWAVPQLVRRHLDFHDAAPSPSFLSGGRQEPTLDSLTALRPGESQPPARALERDVRVDFGVGDPSNVRIAPWLYAYAHNISLPRVTATEVGGFDENFTGWGWEDVEFAYRVYRHWGSDGGRFGYDPDAGCYHLMHLRNVDDGSANAMKGFRYLKRKHLHWEIERLGMFEGPYLAGLHEYPRQLSGFTRHHAPGALEDLARAQGNGRLLWIGNGVAGMTSHRPDDVTYDHASPPSRENLHLLGVDTPWVDGEFAAVISIDVWRMFPYFDLCKHVQESLRVAGALVMVCTDDPATSADPAYLIAMAQDFGLATSRSPFGDHGYSVSIRHAGTGPAS